MNSAALEKLRSGWRGCGVSGWFAVDGGEGGEGGGPRGRAV